MESNLININSGYVCGGIKLSYKNVEGLTISEEILAFVDGYFFYFILFLFSLGPSTEREGKKKSKH